MIKVNNIKVKPGYTRQDILQEISKKLKTDINNIDDFSVIRRSLDARKKDNIQFVLSVKVSLNISENKLIKKNKSNDISLYKQEKYQFIAVQNKQCKNVIVGSGPAGLFAAYIMIKSGLTPIIVERGEKIEDRVKSVEKFFNGADLNTESNIQFGEGGAGTFSDGKLNTGISDSRIRLVLETFVEFGAPSEILTDDFEETTMESKLQKGLFACGEILDIDGDCGGYNLQWAFSSAFLAAKSVIGE